MSIWLSTAAYRTICAFVAVVLLAGGLGSGRAADIQAQAQLNARRAANARRTAAAD